MRLVNQICDSSCVAASIAMVTGKDIETVLKICPSPANKRDEVEALDKLGFFSQQEEYNELNYGYKYVATVPSLNNHGGLHCIAIDARDSEIKVFDPNFGIEGKKYYEKIEDVCWASLTRIVG